MGREAALEQLLVSAEMLTRDAIVLRPRVGEGERERHGRGTVPRGAPVDS